MLDKTWIAIKIIQFLTTPHVSYTNKFSRFCNEIFHSRGKENRSMKPYTFVSFSISWQNKFEELADELLEDNLIQFKVGRQ